MSKASDTTAWIKQITETVKQDPRKSTALVILVVLLAVMLARLLLGGDVQPNRAAASYVPVPASSSAGSVGAVKDDIAVDLSDPDAPRASRTHNSAQRMREWMTEPIKPLSRNIFNVKLEYFPVDGSRASLGTKSAADGDFWGTLEKSLTLQADQRDKRENLLANLRAEAGKLRLDSIMWGTQPKAMIDGKLVAEGDVVASFRVLKIEQRRIIVEREGIRLEILMK